MAIRFLHAADVHLGYVQYGSQERCRDFMAAFRRVVDDALSQETAFLLLSGDLFHKRDADPLTLYEATQELIRLRNAGVAVLAIEGNHERPRQREALSWLDFLSRMGLIKLLTPEVVQGRLVCEAYDDESARGAFVDLAVGIRVIGLQYYGASTSQVLKQLAERLEELPGPRPRYSVLMLHAGVLGVLDQYSATLSREDLEILRPHVDYLAMGHIHKPYTQDDWIYNPGSLEANSTQEALWADRGYFVVQVDPGQSPPHRVIKRRSAGRRFLLFSLAVDRFSSAEALREGVARYLEEQRQRQGAMDRPVVELRLTGTLPFDRVDLDTDALQAEVKRVFAPVLCNVRDQTAPRDLEIGLGESLTRAELERQVLVDLVSRDASKQPRAERWTDLGLSLKSLALARSDPELVIAELQRFELQSSEEAE